MDKQSKLLVCAAFIALLATTVHAQRNIVKLTPFPVLGKLGLQYERQIAGNYSVEVEWQHWEVQRKKSSSFFLFGLLYSSSSSDIVKVSGNRVQVLGKCYIREDMTGLFLEGGFNMGKFDVKRTQESSSFSVLGFFNGDFGSDSKTVTRYDNVRMSGMKFGAGLQRKRGNFFLNFSGGLEFNNADPKVVKVVRAFRSPLPYGRFTVGVGF